MSPGPPRSFDRAQPHVIGADPSDAVTNGLPTYLGLEPSGALAFLHECAGGATGVGTAVLLCPPFGWEEVCCSRSLRDAAALIARAGHSVARLTLPGTADGAGGPRDEDLPHQWVDAVGTAAAWLRERTAASRCVAFGIGLGGMLAYLAAREHKAIDDLALWAVPDRGGTLLREAKSLSKVIAADFPEDQRDTATEGDLELIGYLMSAETQAALSALQLSSLPLPDCHRRRVLLLSRGAQPVDQRLLGSLERNGAQVTALRTSDYYALTVKPEQSQTPNATVAHLLDWLAQGSPPAESRPALRRRTTPRVRESTRAGGRWRGGRDSARVPRHPRRGVRDRLRRLVGRSGAARFASAQLRGAAAHRAQPGLGRSGAALGGTGDPHGAGRPARDR